jgi:hypothetical protein
MQLAASSRYLSDLCRLLLLDGSLQLLAATRPVNVARQVLRMDWNRELLDWLDRRGFGDWIDPSLCEELPGIVQRVPSDRLADDTATIVQLNAAVERISIWVSSR